MMHLIEEKKSNLFFCQEKLLVREWQKLLTFPQLTLLALEFWGSSALRGGEFSPFIIYHRNVLLSQLLLTINFHLKSFRRHTFWKSVILRDHVTSGLKGGSPFSERESRYCKIRSLSMLSFISCARPYVFTSFVRLKKKFNWLELFFSCWRMMMSK